MSGAGEVLLPLALQRRPWRAVLLFGIPLIGATLFQAGFNLTEVWVFGQLGDAGTSMAGAAVSDLVTSFFVFIATGLGNAAVANISHAHGAGDVVRERRHVRQALVAAAIVSLGSAAVGLVAGPIGWLIMGDVPSREPGTAFLRVMAFGGFGTVFLVITTGILRARGEALKTMGLLAGVSIATLAIEAVLVLGLLGLPRYGVIAAAWVTVATRGLTTVAGIWMISRKVDLRPPPGERFIVPAALKLHFKQGFLSAVQLSIRGVGFLILVALAARRLSAVDDGVTFTALNFWIKLDVPTLLLAFGWGGTVGPIVGMSMGAGRAGHGKQAAWWGVLYMALTSLVTMTIVLLFGRDIVGAFIPDSPAVVDRTVEILRHAAPVYWGITAGIVIGLAYNGAGDMRTPLKWDLAILLIFQGTLAWVLSDLEVMGAQGLMWTITFTGMLSGFVPALLLRRARWRPRAGAP